MKNNNFKVSFIINSKDRSKFTDLVINCTKAEVYDCDYRCSKLVASSRYLFEVFFYDLDDALSAMVFISTTLCQADNYCVYPVELAHITFNCLNKD